MAKRKGRRRSKPSKDYGSKHVVVVVYGDIGRSPRMQFHASSLASNGFKVSLIGYPGSNPLTELVDSANVHIHYITPAAKINRNLNKFVYLLFAVWRVLTQAFILLWTLVFTVPKPSEAGLEAFGKPDYILVQNPPAFPTLSIVQLYTSLICRNAKLIIDWHNFGYTLMALNLGANSALVKFASWYEFTFGARAYKHVCVTAGMKDFLEKTVMVRGQVLVLHDRPPSYFRRLNVDEQHALFSLLPETKVSSTTTLFTVKRFCDKPAKLLDARPVLLLSSTSWTEDEDFTILWKALQLYDDKCDRFITDKQCQHRLPPLFVIITGKGPLQSFYMRKFERMGLRHVTVRSVWLPNDLYPKLLGSVDLGISLHKSSSGLDLPMKVVDMFGAGCPVAAINYPTLSSELVHHQKNGLVFDTAEQLTEQISELFQNWPFECSPLSELRKGVEKFQSLRWDENWNETLLEHFK